MNYKGAEYQRFVQEEAFFCENESSCPSNFDQECQGHAEGCSVCEEEVWEGWVCLDGGEVTCENCIYEEASGNELAKTQEMKANISQQKELEIDFILWKLLNNLSYTEKEVV